MSYQEEAQSEMWDAIAAQARMGLEWVPAPGGKRYHGTTPVGTYWLVRQNTAAGAKRWRCTLEIGDRTFVVSKSDYLSDVKFAARNDAMRRMLALTAAWAVWVAVFVTVDTHDRRRRKQARRRRVLIDAYTRP